MTTNFVATPSPIQATYAQGASLEIKVVLTSNHGGKCELTAGGGTCRSWCRSHLPKCSLWSIRTMHAATHTNTSCDSSASGIVCRLDVLTVLVPTGYPTNLVSQVTHMQTDTVQTTQIMKHRTMGSASATLVPLVCVCSLFQDLPPPNKP